VPPALEGSLGRYVVIPGVRFPYGQGEIEAALSRGEAVPFRFVRGEKKGEDAWYVLATGERPEAKVVPSFRLGAVGVDMNPTADAHREVDRFGNPVGTRRFSVDLGAKSRGKTTAILAEVVADVVALAKSTGKPIGVERLDVRAKKARLREEAPEYAQMRCPLPPGRCTPPWRSGGQGRCGGAGGAPRLHERDRRGELCPLLSRHEAATVAIARRGMKVAERLRSTSAFSLPVRNRGKHVLRDGRRVAQGLRGGLPRGRRPVEGGRGRGYPYPWRHLRHRKARSAMVGCGIGVGLLDVHRRERRCPASQEGDDLVTGLDKNS